MLAVLQGKNKQLLLQQTLNKEPRLLTKAETFTFKAKSAIF